MAQVQTVTDILPQTLGSKNVKSENGNLQNVSSNLQKRTEAVGKRYGTREQFMQTMNPSLQSVAAENPERCYFGEAPSLTILNATYGKNTAVMWLIPQLHQVSEFCGCKEKLTREMTIELAKTIQAEWYYLKTSEFLLFFHRFRTGKYGKFYGAVDPLTITSAIWQFIEERRTAYAKQAMEEESRKREAWANEKTMTYEEYKQLKAKQDENTNTTNNQ